jgi:signal transduction histidine kinase
MIKRRLYLRLYVAFLGITVLSLLLTAVLARAFHQPGGPVAHYLAPLARSLDCKPGEPCQGEVAKRLAETSHELGIDIAVWDGERHPLFQAGTIPLAAPLRFSPGWHHTPRGPLWLTSLGDGRMLGLRERGHLGPRGRLFLPILCALLVAMAIGLHPLSRSITRRVEQLAEGARRWGEGDLAHRVPVDGKDEIAALAERFNQAAEAIQALLAQERQMLATASHELRSPLTRIRVALELLAEEDDSGRRAELARKSSEDISELDALVEELLMAARTQPGLPRRPFVVTDLQALVSAEAAVVSAQVLGDAPVPYSCEAAMIKRMVRNLLVNARVHGNGSPIRAEVRQQGRDVLIAVEDDGPGVPEAERERIFAPFYRAPGPRPPGDTGLGLGLALVRQIARYHGGEVSYAARPSTGSRFEVRLPKNG